MKPSRGRTGAMAQVGGLNEGEVLQCGKRVFDVLVLDASAGREGGIHLTVPISKRDTAHINDRLRKM
jgi:hypothetical protein